MKLRKFYDAMTRGKSPIAAAAALLAVLVMVSGITFAWYRENQSTEGTQATIKSDSEKVALSEFTVYYSDGAVTNNGTITLQSYDSVFGRNQNTPLYVLIPVSGEAVQNTGYTLEFSFDCGNDALINGDSGKIMPYLSNVMQVSCMAVDERPETYEDAQGKFTQRNEACFASFTVDATSHVVQSGSRKDSTIGFTMDEHSTKGEIFVLFELDYNHDLITGFVDNYANDFAGRLDAAQNLEFNDPAKGYQETYQITVSAKEKAAA